MPVTIVEKDPQYVLNLCTKYLARDNTDHRNNFGQYASDDPRGTISEAWRFPFIDSHWDGASQLTSYAFDDVTFIWDTQRNPATSVSVLGTFGELYAPVPLVPVPFLGEPSGYLSLTLRIAKGEVHAYRFVVDGTVVVDPINPQTTELDNGVTWSRLFTSGCAVRLALSRRERDILGPLVQHLLPFRLDENSRFITQVYQNLDSSLREQQFPLAYLMDEEVGAVNYIDKVLAREEMHHAVDYHTCLALIDSVMRARYGGIDPLLAPVDMWVQLYQDLAAGQIQGWDFTKYANPAYFLSILRRHAMTGVFAHPRHGGNSGAAGWEYLESRYTDDSGATLFDWRRAIEAPLGHNTDYRG